MLLEVDDVVNPRGTPRVIVVVTNLSVTTLTATYIAYTLKARLHYTSLGEFNK